MLLSLIIPFFNAEKNSKRLLETLKKIKAEDVEIILVNDGSTDATVSILEIFKSSVSNNNIELIDQDNKGPGGARNSGLNIAKGKYVWFVDCDDDIELQAIEVVRNNTDKNYDFIDFNVKNKKGITNRMNIEVGEYNINNTPELSVLLLNNFGAIWSKVIRRELIIKNDIYYPEYCVYEDNPLRFIYPFFVKSFLKTSVIGYIHQLEFDSITRSKPNLKTYDRLYTAIYGIKAALKLATNDVEIRVLEEKFTEKYLIETAMKFFSKKPSKYWLNTWRVMKQYRNLENELGIKLKPIEGIKASRFTPKQKSYLMTQWILSHSISIDQTEYFNKIRNKAWNL